MIRVILADDQELVRVGLTSLAERDGDIQVIAEASNGREAVALAKELLPDVILMNLSMPILGGVEATAKITEQPELTDVRVLVLTTFDDDDDIFSAIRAGASGYLLKDVSPADLRSAIRTVAAGESLLAPAITARVMQAAARDIASENSAEPHAELPAVLTQRESEVFALIGRGLSNEEIATKLYLSPATARTYVSRLLAKLDVRDRAALIVLAYETGAVRPGGGDTAGNRPSER